MDYRFTLNLPSTIFSMKANLSKSEITILEFWNSINLYERQKNRSSLFILNDGPPYANGDIHIGHAFNKILKDIVIKFKNLSGYEVSFIPGWDCHGLPIELNVEKFVSKSKKTISDEKFRSLCRTYAVEQINIQKKSFVRLGVNADWKKFYKTMDKFFELAVVNSFRGMIEKNYIYSGYKPIYWCFDCSSALAEAEIEYENKKSDSIYVFFKLCNKDFLNFNFSKFCLSDIGFVVWTTTPWTLPFNEAVALKYNLDYVLVEFNNRGYIFSKTRINDICEKLGFKKYKILSTFNSSFFVDCTLSHPFYDKTVKILYGENVKSDSGSGCVHIAPAYGHDDYKIALKYKLPVKNSIDEKGFFYTDVFLFPGLHINAVNKAVIDLLKDKLNLLFHETILHRYPYCWRHKTLLIFRTTNQWFFNIDNEDFKSKLLDVTSSDITWIPDTGKIKMTSMLKGRPDWCISRQRIWGIPLILFVDDNGVFHPDTSLIIEKSFDFIKRDGIEFWYNLDVFEIFSIDRNIYKKVVDVLDVWFDSSAVYKYMIDTYNFKLPMDLCIEGSDQYRGWFQVSLINSMANYSCVPYKTVLTHGFVLDQFGKKMSKSSGNVISPNDVVNKYGADVLRLWVSSVNYSVDVNISNEILLRVSEAYRKIRNTFRFLLSNLYDFKPYNLILDDINFLKLDNWILHRFSLLKTSVLNDYYDYKFYFVYKKIYNFCVDDLGSKYLDLVKDRLYTTRVDSHLRKSVQSVLFYLSYNLVKLISPILSFTSEEIWSHLPIKDSESVFLSDFKLNISKKLKITKFEIYDRIFWDKLFLLRLHINKILESYRKKGLLGTSLELELDLFCCIYWYDLLLQIKNELHLFFLVSNVNLFFVSRVNNDLIKLDIHGVCLRLRKVSYIKCERCWHRNVQSDNLNPCVVNICDRCVSNLYYNDEIRFFI